MRLRELHEEPQRLWIGDHAGAHRLFEWYADQQLLHRHLELLAVERAWYRRHGHDLVRHVAWRDDRRDLCADRRPQRIGQRIAGARHEEHRQIIVTSGPLDADHQTFFHLRERFDRPVDVAAADAHAEAVDGRVGPAVDHGTAGAGELHPVAMPPYTREHAKVAVAVARIAGVIPETERHRGHRLRDDKLANLVDEGTPGVVPGLRVNAKRAALQLARAHRQERAAGEKRRAHVRTAALRSQPHIVLDVLIDPGVARRRQWRPCRAQADQRAQVVLCARLQASFLTGAQIAGTSAER